jgi:hypothetical protein
LAAAQQTLRRSWGPPPPRSKPQQHDDGVSSFDAKHTHTARREKKERCGGCGGRAGGDGASTSGEHGWGGLWVCVGDGEQEQSARHRLAGPRSCCSGRVHCVGGHFTSVGLTWGGQLNVWKPKANAPNALPRRRKGPDHTLRGSVPACHAASSVTALVTFSSSSSFAHRSIRSRDLPDRPTFGRTQRLGS